MIGRQQPVLEGEAGGPDYGSQRSGYATSDYNRWYTTTAAAYANTTAAAAYASTIATAAYANVSVSAVYSAAIYHAGSHGMVQVSSATVNVQGDYATLFTPDMQQAMAMHQSRSSLISPRQRRQEEDASSSSVNQETILEEVRRQVALAMQGRDREVSTLKMKNEELERALMEANTRSDGKRRWILEVEAAELPEESMVAKIILERGFGGRRRNFQGVYMGKGDARDSEVKGTIELPSMPELAGDSSAVSFSDWLYETEQAVGGLSDRASAWFTMCLACARETYERYQQSDPIARLAMEPLLPGELKDPKWSRLERRVLTLLLATLQRQAKDDAVTHRISCVTGLLFRLHVLYAPGGSAERASILRHLEGSPGSTHVAEVVSSLRRWRRHLQRAEEMFVAVPDGSVLLRALEVISSRAVEAHPEVKFRLALSKSQLQLQYRPTVENVLKYYQHILAELQQATPVRSTTTTTGGGADGAKLRGINAQGQGAGTGETSSPTRRGGDAATGSGRTPCKYFMSDNGCSKGQGCKFDHVFQSKEAKKLRCWHCGSVKHVQKGNLIDYNHKSDPQPGLYAATASDFGINPNGDWSSNFYDFSFRTGFCDASVNKCYNSGAWNAGGSVNFLYDFHVGESRWNVWTMKGVSSDTSLQELKVQMAGLGFDEDERMALLDSGASHAFRERARHEEDGVPVRVELAGGKSITLQQNKAGTLMPTTDTKDAQDMSTILPLGALVQTLGCELSWTKRGGLKIVHPQFGVLKTVVKGNCPLLGETQALDLIHQLEQKKLQELQDATMQTFLGTLDLADIKDWDEMFATYVQTGVDGELRSLLAVNVGLDDESGEALFERDNEPSEELKVVETDSVMVVNFNLNRSKMFTLKGNSAAFQALMWAACRGQVEGIVGAPPSNSSLELSTKQLLAWMVAKEGARFNRRLSPYLVTTASPASRWWSSTVWQGFQREYQIPVSHDISAGVSASPGDALQLCTVQA
ncbi:GIP [Symbiodinium sp. CCMP2592]|nr:GIP [Symbiodinium sp. CCMP2592]